MSAARAALLRELWKAERHGRLHIYARVTSGGCDINLHSKIGIVDGELLRVGSANLNNRSMGLDSECDLLIDGGRAANAGASGQIGSILCDLLAEHLGVAADDIQGRLEATGSLVQ